MLKVGDMFIWRDVKYTVLEVIEVDSGVYYRVKGECGAIKVYPGSIERYVKVIK